MQISGLDPTLLMVLSILALVIILVVLVVCAVVLFRFPFGMILTLLLNHDYDAVYKTSRGRHLERKMRERACSRSSLVNFKPNA